MQITPSQSDLAERATVLAECWLIGHLVNRGRVERGLDPLDDKYEADLAEPILKEMSQFPECDDLAYAIHRLALTSPGVTP